MLITLLPALGLILSFFSRYLGKKTASLLPILSVIITFLYCTYIGINVIQTNITYEYNIPWIVMENLKINFTFLIDPLSIVMSLLITFITAIVMIYAYAYLENDPSIVRFLSYFALFDVCMLLMVTSGNYVQFFIGWEGVGLTSYLLITFWHTRNEANKGALQAVTLNRIGDIFFMLALASMWANFKAFDYPTIFLCIPEIGNNPIIILNTIEISTKTLIATCLLIAASAKSAQFLLHTWLPGAMEGPTPVSSLLHSATMVTAGIYLIIRSSHIFITTSTISFIMATIGILTALTAGIMGLTQYDLKRIVAYSTCSQLGFMTFACGLGYYSYAMFHLTVHAFYKCLLFLASGSIIHALNDEQDIRKMGNLIPFLPITFTCMTFGTLALIGFPFLAGYYSKDLILETAYTTAPHGTVIFIFGSIAAILTSIYSARSLYMVFIRKTTISKSQIHNIHESPILMLIPLVILTTLSITAGYLLQSSLTGPFSIWGNSIILPMSASLLDHEYISIIIKTFPTTISIIAFILSIIIYSSNKVYPYHLKIYNFKNLSLQKLYIDSFYNFFVAKATLSFGLSQYLTIDRGFLEILGPYGLTKIIIKFRELTKVNSGFIIHYIAIFLVSLLIIYIIQIMMCSLLIPLIIAVLSYPWIHPHKNDTPI